MPHAVAVDLVRGAPGARSDPRLAPENRAKRDITNARQIIDARRPYHRRDLFPEVNKPSPRAAARAREKFGHLLD